MFGMRFFLHDGLQGSCGKLGVLYYNALRWAVAVPTHIHGTALYLLCHTIPLHGLITKQTVRFFAHLEDELQCSE